MNKAPGLNKRFGAFIAFEPKLIDECNDYKSGLIRNSTWRARRQKILERIGTKSGTQSIINEIQAPCHNPRYRPNVIRKVKKKNELFNL